jgi:asparagine synthase (glutamine-hydrolysing)
MCGLVFAVAKTAGKLPSDEAFAAMDAALRHRGPDECGRAAAGRAVMAHRRLRIIDLAGGQQPMASRDGRVWLLYNGEIYNFREIAEALIARGHAISGSSDTEVLLSAYLEWGDACVERLNGMFAFVVYDAHRDRVFAARDRFGEKPLYILNNEQAVYFASELNSFLAGGVFRPVLDRTALYNYLTCKYSFGPRTIFAGVRRLQPGHCLAVENGTVREWAYWVPPRPCDEAIDEAEATRRTLDLLRDAVRLRLVSDVPVGFFLSGGLDSSTIVALASELTRSPLETFGIGFEEARYDERPHQRYVAQRFGARHHELVLKPESIDVVEELAWHLDEPFADSAALPTWFLAQHARRHVVVALSGDGGDELFAGYDVYRGHLLSERLRRLPRFVRLAAAAALRHPHTADIEVRRRRQRLARNIADTELSARSRFVAKQQTGFRRDVLRRVSPLLAPLCSEEQDEALFAPLFDERLDDLEAIALWQQTTSLPDDMLFKVDRMSMAHSLEVRAPFLDHRIAELINRVPFDVKLRRGRTKNVLKTAMHQYLPADFIDRPKQGFDLPLAKWFKEDLEGYARSRLLRRGAVVPHIVDRDGIERLLVEHKMLAQDWSDAIWTLLILELWCGRRGLGAEILDASQPGTAATRRSPRAAAASRLGPPAHPQPL